MHLYDPKWLAVDLYTRAIQKRQISNFDERARIVTRVHFLPC
jgi:hypothetical protein